MPRPPPPSLGTTLHHTLRAAVAPFVVVLVVWGLGASVLWWLQFRGAPGGGVDAIYWAAMILTGMGPPELPSGGAAATKLFLSGYALLSGFVVLGAAGFALQPVFARVLHLFHLDD